MNTLLSDARDRATKYLELIETRSLAPSREALSQLDELDFSLPENSTDPEKVLALLDEIGSPATMASAGARFFGFVTGGVLPAALAANWLSTAWDQNVPVRVHSPIGTKLEEVALQWLVSLFGLPEGTASGFVSGDTIANFTALAAARHALLERQGWDVEKQGLFGAPEIKVVIGEEAHASMIHALRMVGFGSERLTRVPVDNQGRMLANKLPELDDMTLICIQAGNVNSGAFDPAEEICTKANAAGAWVHIDGAFGLWAAASPEIAHLVQGFEKADSWATDAHKWLNVPYDCGIVFCREPKHLTGAMSTRASYLIREGGREPGDYVPQMSRRARAVEIWAALLSLGRTGLANMINRNCAQAQRMGAGLEAAGFDVLNDIVLNQVVVSFGDAEHTQAVIAGIQEEGTFWAGGTEWQGHTAMRISFSSWKTTDEDVDMSLDAIKRVVKKLDQNK